MIVTSLGSFVGLILLLLGVVVLAVEIQYRRRPGNDLILTSGDWQLDLDNPQHYVLVGEMELSNRTNRLEIMVPEVNAEVELLSGSSLDGIEWNTQIISAHADAPTREDHYWFAYIIKSRDKTKLKVRVDIRGTDLTQLDRKSVV